jgi:hypothetical protein
LNRSGPKAPAPANANGYNTRSLPATEGIFYWMYPATMPLLLHRRYTSLLAQAQYRSKMKYIASVKKTAIRTLRTGWLLRDPFLGFNMALPEVEREEHTEEQLHTMAGQEFLTE